MVKGADSKHGVGVHPRQYLKPLFSSLLDKQAAAIDEPVYFLLHGLLSPSVSLESWFGRGCADG